MFKGYLSVAAIVLLASSFTTSALAQNPTPEQIKMFQNLPADQQKSLADKYGFSVPSQSANQESTFQNPQVIQPRDMNNLTGQYDDSATKTKGNEELKRFGLDLFSGSPSTFAPISDVPVPANYTVGAGDEIVVQLFGKDNTTHRLRVNSWYD